ncbi:hypothetical protein COCNU_13G005310 [Cocos nucifera]|uniref:DUF4408 domain-containing protein n=1 Tax=Cocos nucifera TaxID=13894 RepID=A0A8K0IT35_COCNU|nr:hypothetical protein COCNU_13G005310 [Cocos nucifera]
MGRERDLIKQPNKLQAIAKARVPKPLERALQAIILLSILSFLLSNYSSCLHLSSIKAFRNNLDCFVDGKAIFLFFNAILLFLVKDSGLLDHCSSSINRPYDEFLMRKGDHRWPPKTKTMEIEADVGKATTASARSLELDMIEGRRDEGTAAIGIKVHVVDEKAIVESGNALELVVMEGGGDEEAMELVSVDEMKDVDIDELNRRIEEFIERVKRERRMEALKLVMV